MPYLTIFECDPSEPFGNQSLEVGSPLNSKQKQLHIDLNSSTTHDVSQFFSEKQTFVTGLFNNSLYISL